LAGKILDRILRFKLEYWQNALSELGEWVDVVAEGDDFGTQASSLISLELWRRIIKPRQVELITFIKQRAPQAKVFFHSCGNVRDFLPEFIDMGIDIINPVHFTAQGMAPAGLKKDFGADIVFWGGGIDTQNTLPHGTPQQVRDEVKRNLDQFAADGGFVFNTVHNTQADVPPENLIAMYETVIHYPT
jgi:uroporphyrinogen decarboxylase